MEKGRRMTPKFCRECGRELERIEEDDGFDLATGRLKVSVWLECPRFKRSWRKFWSAGFGHTSIAEDGHIERRWTM